MRLFVLVVVVACGDAEPSKNTVRRGLEPSVTSVEITHATVVTERVAVAPPAPVAAVVRPKGGRMFGAEQSGSIPQESAIPVCVPHWSMVSLDDCLGGDGDGCADIGDEYENACDAFSSIKWYRRGCRLGSSLACASLVRLHEPVPPPEN